MESMMKSAGEYRAAKLNKKREDRKAERRVKQEQKKVQAQRFVANMKTAAELSNVIPLQHAAINKLTVEHVDSALEGALTKWQGAGNAGPMPLSPSFSIRARMLGWVENVEFAEVGNG